MKRIGIVNIRIGNGERCLIIAEAGVNLNGDLKLAKNLVYIAKDAGADVVKFQTWITEELMTKDVEQADYKKLNTGCEESFLKMMMQARKMCPNTSSATLSLLRSLPISKRPA